VGLPIDFKEFEQRSCLCSSFLSVLFANLLVSSRTTVLPAHFFLLQFNLAFQVNLNNNERVFLILSSPTKKQNIIGGVL